MTTAALAPAALWAPVCRYTDLLPERGVAAWVHDRQVALFRTADGLLYAVDNRDPVSGANVMSRGIVGSRADRPTVASPMFKQVYALDTGECLDDPTKALGVHPVRVRDGVVEVGT